MCKCIYDVISNKLEKKREMRNVEREVILLSVFLTDVIYMTNFCKEWCCDCELNRKAWDLKGGLWFIYCLLNCMYYNVCFERIIY